MTSHETIAIRRAADTDRSALARLAALDSARVPSGDVLIAEVGGVPHGAIELATGATIADPFRPTAHLVGLLRSRAAATAAGRTSSRRRMRLRRQPAYPAAEA